MITRPHKRTDQGNGDEIEKISQDFQVAQLESLKAKPHAVSPAASLVSVMPSKPSAQPQAVPTTEPSVVILPLKPQNKALSQSLLNSLLSEIVERDIQRQRQRLNGKKGHGSNKSDSE